MGKSELIFQVFLTEKIIFTESYFKKTTISHVY